MNFSVEGDIRLRGLSNFFVSDDLNLEINLPFEYRV